MPPVLPASPARRSRRTARRGLTLLEVVVVLAIIGLTAGALSTMQPPRGAPTEDVITRARRTAVQRAEPLALRLDDGGRWMLQRADGTALATGTDATVPLAMVIRIDALGGCQADSLRGLDAADAVAFDALRCRWADEVRP